jgi:hypothetical protein
MHGLNLTFGIGVEGRFTHGTVSNPAGVVEQACHLVLPRNYMVNQYEPGVQEVANEIMRSSGDKHSLDSRKLHKLYAVAIVQILGVGLVGNWLRNIHNNTVSLSDPKVFLQSMQQQGIENKRLRKRLKRQEERVELDTLEQLVAAGGGLNDEQGVRLEVLRSAIENKRLRERLRYQKNSADHATLEQLVADGGVLNDEQEVRLEVLLSAKERKSEYDRLRYQAINMERAARKAEERKAANRGRDWRLSRRDWRRSWTRRRSRQLTRGRGWRRRRRRDWRRR